MALSERARAHYAERTKTRREDRLIAWREARDAHLEATKWRCEIGPLLAAADIGAYRQCAGRADTCHHALARGMGGSSDDSELLSTCPPCHAWTEANPRLAELIGAKVRHGS